MPGSKEGAISGWILISTCRCVVELPGIEKRLRNQSERLKFSAPGSSGEVEGAPPTIAGEVLH
jgi:hypothetical protein